jgi:cell division protein FtsI/penicillin-binding protein 2
MSSQPAFNSNNLESGWESLVQDPGSPLLNRASQGLYNAGGVLGAFLLASGIPEGDLPEPPWEMKFLDESVFFDCAIDPAIHSLESAVKNGCPAPVSEMVSVLGIDQLQEIMQRIGFNSQPELNLPVAIMPDRADEKPLGSVEEGFLTGINPLQLALAAAAISNEGVRPTPIIVSAVETPDGNWEPYSSMVEPVQAFFPNEAAEAAMKLSEPDSQFWQVVAISPPAQARTDNETGTWYLAGSIPSSNRAPISLALHLEQDNPELAVRIGQSIFRRTQEIYP